jgi:hypothetical protein
MTNDFRSFVPRRQLDTLVQSCRTTDEGLPTCVTDSLLYIHRMTERILSRYGKLYVYTGWQVQLPGEKTQRFYDRKHGGCPDAALSAAREYRDSTLSPEDISPKAMRKLRSGSGRTG